MGWNAIPVFLLRVTCNFSIWRLMPCFFAALLLIMLRQCGVITAANTAMSRGVTTRPRCKSDGSSWHFGGDRNGFDCLPSTHPHSHTPRCMMRLHGASHSHSLHDPTATLTPSGRGTSDPLAARWFSPLAATYAPLLQLKLARRSSGMLGEQWPDCRRCCVARTRGGTVVLWENPTITGQMALSVQARVSCGR